MGLKGNRRSGPTPPPPNPKGGLLRSSRAVLAATLITATAGLAACTAGSTAVPPGRDAASTSQSRTPVVALHTSPASLDFTRTAGAAIPQAMMDNVYETLVRIDAQGKPIPLLATGWEVSPDRTTYTFHLREGVRFSNGTEFNAETAKFSLDRVRSDAWTNGLKKQMAVISSTEATEPQTLTVRLQRPSNSWLWSLGTFVGAMMTPDGVAPEQLTKHPVGTGPYTVDFFAPNKRINLQARPEYWGPKPRNSAAVLTYFPDSVSSANALMAGDVDVIYGLQAPELMDSLRRRGSVDIQVGDTTGEVLLSLNNRRAPFNDPRVRQAIMYAIDRRAVIDTAWNGLGTDTGGSPAAPTDPWYEPSHRYPFDPQKARQLLREAGINQTNNHVVFSVPSLVYATNAAEIVGSQLRDVGLDVSIESTEFPAVWTSKVLAQHNYDMSLVMHAEPRDIPTLFGNPEYYIGFDSQQSRELLSAADSGTPEDQVRQMRRAVDQIMAEAASDTLFSYPNIVVTSRGVTGVNPTVISGSLPVPGISAERPHPGAGALPANEKAAAA